MRVDVRMLKVLGVLLIGVGVAVASSQPCHRDNHRYG